MQAIPQTENPQPLLAALHTIAESPDTSSELVEHLCASLPEISHRLAELSVQLTSRLVDHQRARVAADTAQLPDLASSLNNLANRLGDVGRHEDGLTAIEEAVSIRRTLAEARPDAFLPNLAMSLNNLAIRLGDLGRREDGLTAIEEAVAAYRTLAEARPDAFLPNLAMSLNNLAVQLGDLGQREDGLTAIEEAVRIRRTLAMSRPDVYGPKLEHSLQVMAWLKSRSGDSG
nr:tetratricopeptide repeat protein [Streptomyces sp. SID5470]